MTTLELIPSGSKMVATVTADGVVTSRETMNPDSSRSRKAVYSAAGIDDVALLALIAECRQAGKPVSKDVTPPKIIADVSTITIRGLTETDSSGDVQPLGDPAVWLNTALPLIPVDRIATWKDKKALCCLDVDYHESDPPGRDVLTAIVTTRVTPAPLAWHFSRGGGLHLFYVAVTPFTAEELAAVAALRFRAFDPTAGLELKSVVRGPGDAKVSFAPMQDTATGFVAWLGAPEYSEEEKTDWLERHDMTEEGRYDHTKCPINPTPGHASKGDPVQVSEAGIFCHKCSGEGRSLGCRKPGFAPWASILGAPSAGDLGKMVRECVHWGHARLVLTERYGLLPMFAQLAYGAALKAYHAGGPKEGLIPGVFNRYTQDMARVADQWVGVGDSFEYPKEIAGLMRALPACQFVKPDGTVGVVPEAVTELSQPKDLSRYGYPSLNVVHGFRFTRVFLETNDRRTNVSVVHKEILERGSKFIPRYVPVSQRMKEDQAWAEIETVAPGIDRVLVEAALCAFASAQETQMGLLPVVFVSGPTGAAKTSTLKFAAGIAGTNCGDVVVQSDETRYREAVRRCGRSGPAAIYNEILKDSARGRRALSAKEALDPILNMTPDSMSHALYTGPVRLGRVPAMFLTEPVLPLDVVDETQLARRIRHYRVYGEKKTWPQTIGAAGLGDKLYMLRTVSPRMNQACDAIISWITDRWFAVPTGWDKIADALGVHTIRDSSDFKDMRPWLREFFRLVCKAPALDKREAAVYGVGYKRLSRTEGYEKESYLDKLLTVYNMFTDGQAGSDWTASRRLAEKDWQGALGTSQHVWLDQRADGSAALFRFRVGPEASPTVNESIVDPSGWEELL